MPIDCSDVPSNLTYDCANPWGQDCTSDKHFQFTSLWKYTQNIQAACVNDTRLFIPNGGITSPRNASLTQAACAAIAGSNWTYYPAADIWVRLTAWKFPLLQLVASFPRPPLGFWVEFFVILHLLGDPIDTIDGLLAKMSSCQRMANYWRTECDRPLERRVEGDEDWDWKALALLTDAYGEWAHDERAITVLQQGLQDNPQHGNRLAAEIRQTGRALAADRSTKFLPIIVAQAFFIGAVAIAIFRTASAAGASASSDTVFINVEAHSIAISALYFWIIPAVFLGSIIGVSQTEAAIPEILRRFQVDLNRLGLPNGVNLPNICRNDIQMRPFHGGVYSWQPRQRPPSCTSPTHPRALSYLIVILGTAMGMAVSALVPPDGWDCRHFAEILILIAWLSSAQADVFMCRRWPLKENNQSEDEKKQNQTKLFRITGTKDLLVTIATMGGVVVTQLGLFNRCSCYTLWGKTGLALPEMPDTADTLFHRVNTAYPAITFICIGIELIIVPLFICTQYTDALRIFVQRDDGMSNAKWLRTLLKIYRTSRAKLQARLPRHYLGLSPGRRTNTITVEEGQSGSSYEMTQRVPEETGSIATEDSGVGATVVTDDHLEATESTSQSSGVDSLSRSGTTILPGPEPRHRNTDRMGVTISSRLTSLSGHNTF